MAKFIENKIDWSLVDSLDFSKTTISGNFDKEKALKRYNEISRELARKRQNGTFSKTFKKKDELLACWE